MEIISWYSTATFNNFSIPVYAVPFQWRLLIFIGKNLWHGVSEAKKRQVHLKSYSPKKIIEHGNQILKYKEKVTQTRKINILTRIRPEDLYIHIYQIIKSPGTGPHNSLRHTDNRKYFSGLFLTRNRKKAHMFHMVREVGKLWRCSCWEKGNLTIINQFKYGQPWKIWLSSLNLPLYSTFKHMLENYFW